MTDDIVTRLRMSAGLMEGFPYMRAKHFNAEWVAEAADEIEHLREWKEFAYEMRNKYWWCMRAKTLRKFDALHKADWNRSND